MSARLEVDLLAVGGGIHGAGIARDAAGRGLSVVLVEQGDLACATSSASSKLAHGGLRYLELGDFRLVRESLHERATLMRIAPHLVRPLVFFVPTGPGTRPAWQLRAGLWLYDRLAARGGLPRSRRLDLDRSPESGWLRPAYRRGYCYTDGQADDARLVVINAVDAAARGALVMTRTRCVQIIPSADRWLVRLDAGDRGLLELRARAIVNATGPWVGRFLADCTPLRSRVPIRLIKGSHIVARRSLPGGRALLLQNDDRRVVFMIPFEREFALIGTTDVPFSGDPGTVAVSQLEVQYLLRVANRYLAHPLSEAELAWSFAGVRALADDSEAEPARLTRDYRLEVDRGENAAPIVSIYGGKLTTYRRIAEEALHKLAPTFGSIGPPWTARQPLPGGDFSDGGPEAYLRLLRARHPGLAPDWLAALVQRYGTLSDAVLRAPPTEEALGPQFATDLTAREVEYLMRCEWAREAEDILWRRTKVGLRVTPEQRAALEAYCRTVAPEPATHAMRAGGPQRPSFQG